MPPDFSAAGEAGTLKNIVFPIEISEGARAILQFSTNVTIVDSGAENRSGRWNQPLIRYDVAAGARSLEKIKKLIAFVRIVHGRRDAFLYRDRWDYTSLDATASNTQDHPTITSTDQTIGTGDTSETAFQLIKTYTFGAETQTRNITRPESGTVLIALNGALQTETTHYTIDYTTGIVTFVSAPGAGVAITAGYRFYIPMRFDTDQIEITHESDGVGGMSIPLAEVREA